MEIDKSKVLLELRCLRDQVDRLAQAVKEKKGDQVQSAWFAASDRISTIEGLCRAQEMPKHMETDTAEFAQPGASVEV